MDIFLFLQDLRRRIIAILIAIILVSCVCYFFRENIWCLIRPPNNNLIFIAPAEALSTSLKVSVFGGVFLSLPFIFYQAVSLFQMVAAGFSLRRTTQPKGCGYQFSSISGPFFMSLAALLLFVIGAVFAYCIVIPQALRFFLQFENEFLSAQWAVSRYLSFFLWTVFSFGLMFEIPLVLYFLTKFGIIKTSVLRKERRYAVLVIFIAAGILTPGPDVLSQILLAGPLVVLYELSIWISCFA